MGVDKRSSKNFDHRKRQSYSDLASVKTKVSENKGVRNRLLTFGDSFGIFHAMKTRTCIALLRERIGFARLIGLSKPLLPEGRFSS